MNTPVSYELAILLKTKGFDEQSLLIYLDGKIEELRSTISNSQCTTSRTCSAPIIAEVIMWLYEKHNIWISVTYQRHSEGKHWRYTINQIYRTEIVLWEHNTPTEAYEAAIKYCLEKCI